MIKPSMGSLLEKVGNRYELCTLVGKRARQLTDGAQQLTKCNSHNVVTIAIDEINDNMLTCVKKRKHIE